MALAELVELSADVRSWLADEVQKFEESDPVRYARFVKIARGYWWASTLMMPHKYGAQAFAAALHDLRRSCN